VLDYVARGKVGGAHLNFFIVKQFAVLPPSAFEKRDVEFIFPRVAELTYTATDLKGFAEDLGIGRAPFVWDEERRAHLRAELDSYFAAMYGLTRDELRYTLDPAETHGADFPAETFRLVKANEMKRLGEYRTQRLVLEAWDRLDLQPRNRDGRYEAGPRSSNGAASPATLKPICNGSSDASSSLTPALPPLVLQRQIPANRTHASQAALPGLRDETATRLRALDLALQVIATSGPITSKDIAQQLSKVDARIDRRLVNSVLYNEGAALVDYDKASTMYRPKLRR